MLYTSGTTGKPKGVVHTTGGYLTHVLHDDEVGVRSQGGRHLLVHRRHRLGHRPQLRRLRPAGGRRDGGDVRGRAELSRERPLLADHREVSRVDIFYTAPTAIRTFIKWGDSWVKKHDLSSLRLLGTVGEPINPEAWMWYHKVIGGERCPIVDTWWQTETGGIMISAGSRRDATKPGSATRPLPGIAAEVVTRDGKPVAREPGRLPGDQAAMARDAAHDLPRSRALQVQQYFSQIDGIYFTGDGARRDEDGYFWIMGRVDDVHQRLRPSPGHDGGRERAGVASRRSPRRPWSGDPTR